MNSNFAARAHPAISGGDTSTPAGFADAALRTGLSLNRKRAMAVLVVGAVLWAVVGFVVMPYILTLAHRGAGFGFITKRMDHRDLHPASMYIAKWCVFAGYLLAGWIVAGTILLLTTSRWFARHCVGLATPGTLGAVRAYTCLVMIYCAFCTFGLADVANLPASQRVPMGIMNLCYRLGFDTVVHNLVLGYTVQTLCIALLILGMVGWKTRLVLPLAAILYIPLAGVTRSYFWFNHTNLVPSYLLVILCFTRCGDGFSVDRLIKVGKGNWVPPADQATPYYAWARMAVWCGICIPYVMAGLSKLRNGTFWWWTGNNMQQLLFTDGLRPGGETFAMQLVWVPAFVFGFLGAMTIVSEVGMILVVFSKRARLVWPIMCAGMHVGILVSMRIAFIDLILIQVLFYDWRRIRHWAARKIDARNPRIIVLYDGHCPLCRRAQRVMTAMDLFGRLNFEDFRALPNDQLAHLAQSRGVTVSRERLEREMVVLKNGNAYGGGEGYRAIAPAVPALWLTLPMLVIPGLSHLSSAIYRVIARNRLSILQGCSDHCALAPSDIPPAPAPAATSPDTAASRAGNRQGGARDAITYRTGRQSGNRVLFPTWRRRLAPLTIAGMFILFMGLWSMRTEWYPLTSMQMFSTYTPGSTIQYYRAYNTFEDGSVAIAKLDEMGQGQPRYGPMMWDAFFQKGLREQNKLPPDKVRGNISDGELRCIDLLTRSAEWWNRQAPPGKRVMKIEAVKREWDFIHDRDDPAFGRALDRLPVEILPRGTSASASMGGS